MTEIFITLPIEFATKAKKLKKSVARCLTPWQISCVPDSPDPERKILGVRIERSVIRKIKRLAKADGISVSDWVRRILIESTNHVKLTSQDYVEIAEEIRKAERKLSSRDQD